MSLLNQNLKEQELMIEDLNNEIQQKNQEIVILKRQKQKIEE